MSDSAKCEGGLSDQALFLVLDATGALIASLA